MSQQDFFTQKVQEAPENKLFRFSLSKILFDQEQFIEAIPHLEKCIQLQDDWTEEQNHDDPKNEILGLLEHFKH